MTCTRLLASLLICLAASTARAAIDVLTSDRFGSRHMTCDAPVALTRDCSIRQGPTRPVAIAGFRMNVAGDVTGRTILIGHVRNGPDHNAQLFTPTDGAHAIGIAAIRALHRMLYARGICLERWQPVTRGSRITGYLLTFSDAVYADLLQHTVLESEHWLPGRLSQR